MSMMLYRIIKFLFLLLWFLLHRCLRKVLIITPLDATLYAYKRCIIMWNRPYYNGSWIFKWIGLSNERVAKLVKCCCAFKVTRRESLIKDFPELQWKENDSSSCQFCNWIFYVFLNIRYLLTVLFLKQSLLLLLLFIETIETIEKAYIIPMVHMKTL